MDETKYLHLLSRIHSRVSRMDEAMTALNRAKEAQTRVLKRVAVEQPESLAAQKKLAASICQEIAAHASAQRDNEKAIRMYNESLGFDPGDEAATLELANLYLTID